MASNFMNLKRSGATQLETINKKIADLSSGGFAKDERVWFPVQDKAGNGSAVIRFLSPSDGEDVPFVRYFHYGIKGNGWYIENSLATLGLPDPASELYFELKNSGDEDGAKKLSRRMSFISNIYVVKHAARPEDEGKVFLFKYGKKIFDKLQDAMTPDENTGVLPMNPFDMWEGANFLIKIKKVQDFNNYDDSKFLERSALLNGDDKALEKVWEQQYPLNAEIAPDKFKSYDELKKKLYAVLGIGRNSDSGDEVERFQKPKESKPKAQREEESVNETAPGEPSGSNLEFFKKLRERAKAAVEE